MESSLNATVQLGATLIVAETNAVNKAILAEADVKDSEYTVQREITWEYSEKFDTTIADLQKMESAIESNYRFKVLIVAKMKLPSIQPSLCRFIQKKGQYCCSFTKQESIITLKR
jgi:hypothetical protein